jgi:hypothetical protein
LRNWSGNLIKRDKSFHILSRLKILGVIDFSQCLRPMHLMSGSQPNSGKAKFNAGDKGNYFFKWAALINSNFSGQPQTYLYQSLIPVKVTKQKSQWQREMKFKMWICHYCTAQQPQIVQPWRPL